MAALKLTLDSLDGIDDAVKSLYVEKDGKHVLDVEGVEDTTGLKTALQKERKRAEDEAKARKAYEKLGKTPDEIRELLEAQEAHAMSEAERKGEWEKLKTQMNAAHAEAIKAKDETIGQMRKRLEAELVDAKATAAIAAAKGVPDLLLPHVQRFVRVDDGFNVQVVDAKGDPRVNGKGEPLTISDLIAEMKTNEIYGRAFEGAGQSGSGTLPAGGAGSAQTQIKRRSELKSREDRVAFVEKHGEAAYFALPA